MVTVFSFLVPEVTKRRSRIIFDALFHNTFSRPAPRVNLRRPNELLEFLVRGKFFLTFDFKAYFFQFELADSVSQQYVGEAAGRFFSPKRCMMGHKNAVHCASAVTQLVSRIAVSRAIGM
jgi:hypothetical protein